MVGGGGKAAVEIGGEVFGIAARGGVDDGGARGGRAEEFDDELVAAGAGEFDDLDGEVGAAEAVDEELGVVKMKLGDDVLLDGGRGGGG
jgi:hypothetical protein